MDLKVREQDGVRIFEVMGEVTALTADELKRTIGGSISGGSKKVIVDLDSADQVDSAGLTAFISIFKTARSENARFVIVCGKFATRQVFDLTRLDKVLEIYPNLEEAMAQV